MYPSTWKLPGMKYYLGVYFRDRKWVDFIHLGLLSLILWRVW